MKKMFSMVLVFTIPIIGHKLNAQPMVTTSSYGLYFRSNMGGDVTLDNNGKLDNDRNDLSRLQGPLYWNDTFANAKLFLKSGELLGTFPVRFNRFTKQFHVKFPDAEEDKIVMGNLIGKVIYQGTVNGMNQPMFTNQYAEKIQLTKGIPEGFMLQLTNEPMIILKNPQSLVMYKDSLFGTIKKPFLVPEDQYFVSYKGGFAEVKKLKAEQFAYQVPALEGYFEWFKKERIRWNDDRDLIRAVEYFNKQQKQ